MARDFAKSFYNSKKWKRARQLKISTQHGICERCGKAFASKHLIVHHKIYLTPQNVRCEDVSLSQANLECICHDCHNREHMSKKNDREIYFDDDGNVINVHDRNEE